MYLNLLLDILFVLHVKNEMSRSATYNLFRLNDYAKASTKHHSHFEVQKPVMLFVSRIITSLYYLQMPRHVQFSVDGTSRCLSTLDCENCIKIQCLPDTDRR